MSKHPDVFFTEPGEFVDEMVRDQARGLVERGIVRVTKVGRPAMNGTITRVTVEAAAVVDARVVRLRHPIGELRGIGGDEQAQTRARSCARWRARCSTAGSSSEPGATARTDAGDRKPRSPLPPSLTRLRERKDA